MGKPKEKKITVEKRLEELKAQSRKMAEDRGKLMKALDANAVNLMKTGGAIEELKKLVDNKKEEEK